uniref:Predicted protein n=1 Tax=Physcomitrium patens TaxID=3218 RepID=A9U712_PHYPA
MTDQRRLLRGESLALAKGLAAIGSGMEQRGLAHCDLSAPNVMLPFFSEVELPEPRSVVELVDIEQMYSPKLDRPDVLLAGSPGYAAHRTVQSGLWSGYADRFAGAVIIAEMLGWCDPQVVEKAWGESYFDQPELQNPCERYFILRNSLERNWGAKTAELFARAWESQDLSSCPTFGEWLVLLSTMTENSENADESVTEKQDAVQPAESPEPLVSASSPALRPPAVPPARSFVAAAAERAAALTKGEGAASGDQDVVNRLFHQARELESSGNLSGALEVYKSAHHFVSEGSPMEIELEAAIRGLESELNPPGPDRKQAKVAFYQSRKWLTSAVVVILLLAGTAFAVNQIVADHSPGKHMEAGAGTKPGGEKAPAEASRAITELQDFGFPPEDISVVTRDREDLQTITEDTGTKAPEGVAAGAATGGMLGGVAGLLAGIGALAIPGIGPILAAGPIAATLAGAAVGAGAGGLVGGLIGLGIPEDEAKEYETYVDKGKILVIVDARGRDRDIYDVFNRNRSLNAERYNRDLGLVTDDTASLTDNDHLRP